MAAYWNLTCPEHGVEPNVACSMFAIPLCPTCAAERTLASCKAVGKSAIFPFEGRHITPDGKPIVIQDMQHLRRVEREYGVTLSAFSKANINDTDPIQGVPRYRAEDAEFRHNHRGRS